MMCHFPLATFKIFSLSLVVSILITMYLSVVFLMFLELEFFEILGSVGSLFLSFLKHLQPLLLQIFCSLPFFVEFNFTSIRQLEVILQFNDSIYIFSSFFPSVSVSFCSAVSKLILMLPSWFFISDIVFFFNLWELTFESLLYIQYFYLICSVFILVPWTNRMQLITILISLTINSIICITSGSVSIDCLFSL